MKIELDKKGLQSLAKGMKPNYEIMDHPLIKNNGSYTGGFHDKWDWNYSAFEKNTEKEIYEAYLLIRKSWDDG